jgi:hypothetical protein
MQRPDEPSVRAHPQRQPAQSQRSGQSPGNDVASPQRETTGQSDSQAQRGNAGQASSQGSQQGQQDQPDVRRGPQGPQAPQRAQSPQSGDRSQADVQAPRRDRAQRDAQQSNERDRQLQPPREGTVQRDPNRREREDRQDARDERRDAQGERERSVVRDRDQRDRRDRDEARGERQDRQDARQERQNRREARDERQDRRDVVRLNDRQRTRISTVIRRSNIRPLPRVDFALAVGTAVPAYVQLATLPPAIIEIVPQYRGYTYFVVQDEIVIVHPQTKRIVTVIPYGGSARAQAERSDVRLSEQQRTIIRRQVVERRPVRTRTEIVVGETLPDNVELYAFPETIYTEVPVLRQYRYFVREPGEIVVVDPDEQRIVEIIE